MNIGIINIRNQNRKETISLLLHQCRDVVMIKMKVNFNNITGIIKPMHAVNNGPVGSMTETHQVKSNFTTYKAAKIPYARNHDASFCSDYGGEHTVDVHMIFPDFTKNPYNPESYDFTATDDYLKRIDDVGTEVFYRLGTKIEHQRKKYGSIVPADFKKWAVIAEHIIRHYTSGWADGFNYTITYWEIWNEPDGVRNDGDRPNWSGTPEEYYEFYDVVARHLKERFPHLKIGGPALSWVDNIEWFDNFMKYLTRSSDRTPLDFFSWHAYPQDTNAIIKDGTIVRQKLDEYGYTDTENILNEWNYLEGWTDKFVASIEGIISMRGAAFTSAVMARSQKSSIDMLMYYDARPCGFNGMFDYYTLRPLKGYYPFLMFSKLYELKNEVESSSDDGDLYIAAAKDENKKAMMVTYYSLDKNAPDKNVEITGINNGEWYCYYLDADRTLEKEVLTVENGYAALNMPKECVVFITNTEDML